MRRSLRASSISILLTLLLGPWEAAVDGEPQQWNREANSDAVTIAPGQDIQSIVDAAPAGTQFRLVAGVHRLQQIKPRSFDRFEGEPGAVLNGARLLDDFGREGDLWTSAGPSRQRRQDGYCRQIREEEVYGGCRYPEDLYLDDEPLRRVEHRHGQLRRLVSTTGPPASTSPTILWSWLS